MSDVLRTTAAYRLRREASLCVWCGRPAALRPSGVAYAHCVIHRAIDAAKTDRNGRQAKLRHLAAGRCYECGSFCVGNPRTGKPFNLCMEHRLRQAARRLHQSEVFTGPQRRILAVVTRRMSITDIRAAAKMDTQTCASVVEGLVTAGAMVRTVKVSATRGRKGFLYARVAA
jgi:ferredoxin